MTPLTDVENAQKLLKQQSIDSVSSRDAAEQALDYHKSIYEQISSGLIRFNEFGVVTFVNKAAAIILKYKIDELVGTKVSQFLPNDKEFFILYDETLYNQEFPFTRSDGKTVLVTFYTNHLDGNQNAVIIFHEISASFNNPKNINQVERLNILGDLSIGIAHELRNPLAGIKSISQTLEEFVGDKETIDGKDLKQYLDRIIKGVDRVNDILQSFFKFAQPAKPKPDYVDVEMLISGIYLLLAPIMRENDIQFRSDAHEKIPPVYVDINQVEQALYNLFMNAIDAMQSKPNGVLSVEASVKIRPVINDSGIKLEKKMVCIDVSDTGDGIKSENLAKIFNPFYTTKPDHIGLGLAISSRVLEENKGWIEVVSEESSGASFTLLIPSL
jgi:PAS domain S-box-containing protein